MANQRSDMRKGIGTTAEVIERLEISQEHFKKIKKDPNTKLIPSKVHGKWIWSSVLQEFKRIHGVSCKEAVA